MKRPRRSRAIRDNSTGLTPNAALGPDNPDVRAEFSQLESWDQKPETAIQSHNITPLHSRDERVTVGGFAPLTFDPDEFMQFVADQNLSEEEARTLLSLIWEIVVSFVDVGFGIHPSQTAKRGGGGEKRT